MDKKMKNLSLQEKYDVIKMITEDKKKVADAVKKFKCGKTQIYSIIKEKDKIMERYMNSSNVNAKKKKDGNFAEINKHVFDWFLQTSTTNVPISGSLLKVKAKEAAKLLKFDNFSASNGWLQSFKRNYGIICSVSSGESTKVDNDIVKNWFTKLKGIIKRYEPKNVANVNATALFYTAVHKENSKTKKIQFSKEQLTIILTTFADGSFGKPWVIGKSKNLNSFKNIKTNQLSVEWKSNKKAKMTKSIFRSFLNKFNNKMKKQKRTILLFVDNAMCNLLPSLSNIKLVLFPPFTKMILQPLDSGIIQEIKVNYRKLMLQKVVSNIKISMLTTDSAENVDVLEAITLINHSMKLIDEESVKKSFGDCGFLFENGKVIDDEIVKVPMNILGIQKMNNFDNCDTADNKIDFENEIARELGEVTLKNFVDSQTKDDEDMPMGETEPLSKLQIFNYLNALKEFGKVKGDQQFYDKVMDLEIYFNEFGKTKTEVKS